MDDDDNDDDDEINNFNKINHSGNNSIVKKVYFRSQILERPGIYIILDDIEGCVRIYCTHHDDIHRASTAR